MRRYDMVDVGLGQDHGIHIGKDTETFPSTKGINPKKQPRFLNRKKNLPDFKGHRYMCGKEVVQAPHNDDDESINFIGSR
jgi:hypothetical protein